MPPRRRRAITSESEPIPVGEPSGGMLAGGFEAFQHFCEQIASMGRTRAMPVGESTTEADGRGASLPISRFMQLNPTTFAGSTDPLEASRWLADTLKTLNVLDCPNHQRVSFATFLLRGDAESWWSATQRLLLLTPGIDTITWDVFAEAFDRKYFPEVMKMHMETEFGQLTQGLRSVAEYEATFASLSRFAPELVALERSRAKRFCQGLSLPIRERLTSLGEIPYATLVSRALFVETDIQECQALQAERGKERRREGCGKEFHRESAVGTSGYPSHHRSSFHPYSSSYGSGSVQTPSNSQSSRGLESSMAQVNVGGPMRGHGSTSGSGSASGSSGRGCFTCRQLGHRAANCPTVPRQVICFQCGQPGHMRATCPLLFPTLALPSHAASFGASRAPSFTGRGCGTPEAGSSQRGRNPHIDRVFAMTEQDIKASNDVTTDLSPRLSMEEGDAFFVVRKGNTVGIYRKFSDCQAQISRSVSNPAVSAYKGYSLSKETEDYLASRGLKNALYTINAADLKEDMFGTLSPCCFQEVAGSSLPSMDHVKRPIDLDYYVDEEPISCKRRVDGSSSTQVLKKSLNLAQCIEAQPVSNRPMLCILEFDGASKGNPGKAGAGAVLRTEDGRLISRLREGLGVATNNVAEYQAVILGLKYALKKGFRRISVRGDSQLVCMQVQGLWQTKNQDMAKLCKEVKELKENFLSFEISHMKREFNADADTQANIAVNLPNGAVSEERGEGF